MGTNELLLMNQLDEGLQKTKMNQSTPADQSYYEGLMQATFTLGYYIFVDSLGGHTLIRK